MMPSVLDLIHERHGGPECSTLDDGLLGPTGRLWIFLQHLGLSLSVGLGKGPAGQPSDGVAGATLPGPPQRRSGPPAPPPPQVPPSASQESVLLAQQHSYVVLGGDFNAKVFNLPDALVSEQQQLILDSGLPFGRGSSHARVNLHGRLVLGFCAKTRLLLGTERLLGDATAPATHASGSRLDHFLMECYTLARAVHSHVVPCRHDSDHKPIVLSLVSAATTEGAAAAPANDRRGQPLPRLWDGAKQEEYAQQLRGSLPSLDDCHRLVKDGQVEVQKALPKLSNAKAPGQAGWPAELLRHATYWLEDEHGNRDKILLLVPLLTDFLNAFFLSGSVQACFTCGLVTPIHKKGCSLDPANYRPIAVGEPLYKLYTTILDDRLVRGSEEHGLCSPAQAGFRPGKSTAHHLFALRHFIDHALLTKRPLYTCFVDLQKAY
ncbi:hypothetical protein WJX74_007421 [Apatococcus lobatus]|uniref:Reverse transcriptase domain-containing protein n=1 Tax=Apatococcus lobatus TaxID=904363 RepID=A0AAW1QAP3_9CHLO